MVFLYFIALLSRSSHLQTVQRALSIDSAGYCSGKHSQILQQAVLEMPPYFLLGCAILVFSFCLSVEHFGPERDILTATGQIVH